MPKHLSEAPITYLHWFTTVINKLRVAVSPGEAIQVPPMHMLAYYLLDGLQHPTEDFILI
eukprot:8672694-Ditylum_brightwellii.AAC.1